MEHKQSTWINVSFFCVFLSPQSFILQSTAETRDRQREGEQEQKLPKRLTR